MLVSQSSPTLCNIMAGSPPGSSVLGIFQARILEWVAISSSRDQTQISALAGRLFINGATREAFMLLQKKNEDGAYELVCNDTQNIFLSKKSKVHKYIPYITLCA